MKLPGRRETKRKKVNATRERMAVHEEAARLQQGSVFQTDGGLDRGAAYAQAAKNYEAGKLGGRTWGSSDRTINDKKGY